MENSGIVMFPLFLKNSCCEVGRSEAALAAQNRIDNEASEVPIRVSRSCWFQLILSFVGIIATGIKEVSAMHLTHLQNGGLSAYPCSTFICLALVF